jgi:lipid II isoglutaminyl synthase (glutamine-hydrolysing)
MIRTYIATYSALLSKYIIRSIGKGKGEAAPGLVALKIDPHYIQNRQKKIPLRILISGTNGKTTTTHLIGKILKDAGKTVLTNPHGSNLSRGIASALTHTSSINTTLWETDEAALVDIFLQTMPTHVLLLNLFRDQLDRYGEIDTVMKKWITVLKQSSPITLIINADDPSLEYIARQCSQHTIIRFGLTPTKVATKTIPDTHGDAIFCPQCQKPLRYLSVSYSHLGNYTCSCGFMRGELNYKIEFQEGGCVKVNKTAYASVLRGCYSAYNIGADISLAETLHLPTNVTIQSISTFKPSFGRQEEVLIGDKKINILLIKNPTGANENIEILRDETTPFSLLIAINDNYADGRDISWLWDVSFENIVGKSKQIIVTGTRTLDIALRLKYAGIDMNSVTIERELATSIELAIKSKPGLIYILPTYTAMIEIRRLLSNKAIKQ